MMRNRAHHCRLEYVFLYIPAPSADVPFPDLRGLREALAVTMTGVNLYCASTGQELESVAPVRSEDEIIDMLGVRDVQIIRGGSD